MDIKEINLSAIEWEEYILNSQNTGKERILDQIAEDKLISKDEADYLKIKYQIITYTPKRFTSFFRKFFKVDKTKDDKSAVYSMIIDTKVTREEYDKQRLGEKLNGDE